MRYEVHTYTLCQGWNNTWIVDDHPVRFNSIQEAQAEISELVRDIEQAIRDRYISFENKPSPNDYRIYDRRLHIYIPPESSAKDVSAYTMRHYEIIEDIIGGFHIDELDTVDSIHRNVVDEYGAQTVKDWLRFADRIVALGFR